MRRATDGELLCSEAERRVRVVQYTPPLYTIHTSCRSSVSKTCTWDMYGLQTVVCIAQRGLGAQPRSVTVSTWCVAWTGRNQSGAGASRINVLRTRWVCLVKCVI